MLLPTLPGRGPRVKLPVAARRPSSEAPRGEGRVPATPPEALRESFPAGNGSARRGQPPTACGADHDPCCAIGAGPPRYSAAMRSPTVPGGRRRRERRRAAPARLRAALTVLRLAGVSSGCGASGDRARHEAAGAPTAAATPPATANRDERTAPVAPAAADVRCDGPLDRQIPAVQISAVHSDPVRVPDKSSTATACPDSWCPESTSRHSGSRLSACVSMMLRPAASVP